MNRALVVGINDYPDAPLRGCVADAWECVSKLTAGWGDGQAAEKFKWRDVSLCLDRRAHAEGLRSRLSWLASDASPGDRIFFAYSGHGAQVPVRGRTYEVDGLVEVLCPADFDADDDESWIIDVDLVDVLEDIPTGVNCVVLLDSCFSGGMDRAPLASESHRSYPIEKKLDFKARMEAARERELSPLRFLRAGAFSNVAFIEGCQESQTCAEVPINGSQRGVLSYYFWDTLGRMANEPLSSVVEATAVAMREFGATQVPRLVGAQSLISKPFMAKL